MPGQYVQDEEFGTISLRRSTKATAIRIRITPSGHLRASLPIYAPTFLVKRLIKNSRNQLRELLHEHRKGITFTDGMQLGKSHTLVVRSIATTNVSVARHGQQVIVSLPAHKNLNDHDVVTLIREKVTEALRTEAKAYLSKRLAYLAAEHRFTYEKVRFSHAGGRWGSCSSSGTISLNIALMKLPFELIDYVLIHELSHTVEMNHSGAFWHLVETADPHYKTHRRFLKKETPSI